MKRIPWCAFEQAVVGKLYRLRARSNAVYEGPCFSTEPVAHLNHNSELMVLVVAKVGPLFLFNGVCVVWLKVVGKNVLGWVSGFDGSDLSAGSLPQPLESATPGD